MKLVVPTLSQRIRHNITMRIALLKAPTNVKTGLYTK